MIEYANCPVCRQTIELTPRLRRIKSHEFNSRRCDGSGRTPQPSGPESADPQPPDPQPADPAGARVLARLKRPANFVYGLIFTAVAGGLGILQFFGVGIHPATIGQSPEQLVSADAGGRPANGDSGRPSMDASGRYVVFTSAATNLAPGSSGRYNVYRKDRQTKRVILASAGPHGPGDGDSQFPIICSTGRVVGFASNSTNLVADGPPVTGQFYQVYIYDIGSERTTLISMNDHGAAADGDSRDPKFNGDCTKVLFESRAANLVADDHNGAEDVFVRDLSTGRTQVVTRNDRSETLDNGSGYADIDASGTVVAFTSWATNLPLATAGHPSVYLRDLRTGRMTPVSAAYPAAGPEVQGYSWPDFSADGRYLVFRSVTDALDPTRRGSHVFVWDVGKAVSAIIAPDGRTPAGWNDACTTGVDNGTNFSPVMGGRTRKHSYRVLFTVADDGVCKLRLRDLRGDDVPIRSSVNIPQILEPTINGSGDYLSWAVAGSPQQVYACRLDDCTDS